MPGVWPEEVRDALGFRKELRAIYSVNSGVLRKGR
jgi:hypothetical protein